MREKIYTAIGIALSFAVAVGGWLLTDRLISMKSDALLSESGVTLTNAPRLVTITDNNGDDISNERPILSELEIVSVLQNWESPGREFPHEPTAGQIGMEQAIEAGRAGLLNFAGHGIIPAELLGVNNVNASLCQNLRTEEFLDPAYSYWSVAFTGPHMGAAFIINAVTGQVWNAAVAMRSRSAVVEASVDDLEYLLDAFMSDIGINSDSQADVATRSGAVTMASKGFADNNARAFVSVTGRPMEENKIMLMEINLYLSAAPVFTTGDIFENAWR